MAERIRLGFGDTVVYARLKDTETARAFERRLPVTVHVSGTGVDFCGRMPFSLPYEQEQVHRGWANGDVNYNPGGGWLAVLYGGEEGSGRYGDQVDLARIDSRDLDRVAALDGAFDLVVERAE